jgi:hypothetical protein
MVLDRFDRAMDEALRRAHRGAASRKVAGGCR